jgi:hypothetical protein
VRRARVGDAERAAAAAELLVHLVGEPALVPELERAAEAGGQEPEQVAEAAGVLLEVRRELEEHGAELVAEAGRGVAEVTERIAHASRAMWVMRWGAFSVKRNAAGVSRSQPATALALGMR